ncbi:transaldolase [Collimonas sp. OK307]|uniref:transaldolase n=1 Tax=Collimonas sp. OK307 TaxID=1801620 RepID=UPI0008EB916E|nr:transaldolase [Collimonas sp. OK307]SFI37871.1 transaldolase [Collimonas sp. OK307]
MNDANNVCESSRLKSIAALGQQIWLDNLSRELLDSGELSRWISDDGIAGVTSNPAIFYNAIRTDPAYQAALPALRAAHADAETCFEALVLPDIQRACDLLAPLYSSSQGVAGFVSFEVSPNLAHDVVGTIISAQRLWKAIARPNVMIKIPATQAGIQALEEVIFAGINVNVTLIFSARQGRMVRAAHRRGLQRRIDASLPVDGIASVASVFISRIDAMVDMQLPDSAAMLRGKAAIAAAKIAYRDWQQDTQGAFAPLARAGAQPQLLLWASTGTKNPAYRDVMYVEDLIGNETVNTVPDATLAAFRDHGEARGTTLSDDVAAAESVLSELVAHGIDLEEVGAKLLITGLTQFEEAFVKLLALVE